MMRKSVFDTFSHLLKSSLRGANRGQANFELGKEENRKIPGIFLLCRKIGMTESVICRSLDVFLQKRGMIENKNCRNRGMTFVLWILVSSTSMTGTVKAECVPTQDCASIGYTETSCETQAVKCPFDTSKLFCLPCDSSYQYSCNGTGQKGKGTACNGKYIECECSNGYDLVDGACIVSCSYNLTSLPTGCSAVSDSCIKNGTTYYSSTCTSCQYGYHHKLWIL